MKRMAMAAMALVASAGMAMADPVLGTWKTEVDDGSYAYVEMQKCGANICGTIARTFKDGGEYKSPNIGKMLVRNMAPQGNGQYEGKVWRPSNDKIYIGKIDLQGNSLKLRGCVAGGLICARQTWTRVQ
ncbi:Uncharacterized conserved protein, DUF2147 family [Roseovarius pacificus]|uniref:Uncharacterized conserved protein, DUF2147 family n=1 Tax=Roseovarius pacificus TaxID=337701 RepID=A0A1M7D868_9RHOB|nr:DUF2147 domain-containing protein [Roseovarius pacificus]GGO56594.1 hypothetical protein GCM10011315_21790 [Roseovarius pacificus]SHL75640.1 Uncharacterized conserved protein, DUF2147 family [Roseovarius pacificus]